MNFTKDKKELRRRPELVTDEHLDYLDNLRKSGVTNMLGAGQYVEQQFGISKSEAQKILVYWIETFGKEGR